MTLKLISPAELNEHFANVQSGYWDLRDVRSNYAYISGHIPLAKTMPLHPASDLNPDAITILYCKSGKRSGAEARELSELGFDNVYSLEGGLNRWTAAGFPVTSDR